MSAQNKTNKSKPQFGLFLFFVVGLFMLQIAFAFTIHGDIGPQTSFLPGIDKPASPILIGRIDSLVSNCQTVRPVKVSPEGAFAPANKNVLIRPQISIGKIDTETSTRNEKNCVRKVDGDRFYEYCVQSGDSLTKISKRLYGSSKMVQSLIRINRIKNEKCLQLGSALRVPGTGILKSIEIL